MAAFDLPSLTPLPIKLISYSNTSSKATKHPMASDKDLDVHVLNGDSTQTRPTDHNGYLADPEMVGLTLYEKKAVLVNRELDSNGMGKYQWYIFFLCGFGYLVDLLYALAFGLIEPAIQQEFGFLGICLYFS